MVDNDLNRLINSLLKRENLRQANYNESGYWHKLLITGYNDQEEVITVWVTDITPNDIDY